MIYLRNILKDEGFPIKHLVCRCYQKISSQHTRAIKHWKKRIPKSGPSVQNGSTSRQQKWTKHSNKNDNCTINNRDFDYLLPQEQSLYHHQEWGMGLRFYIRVVLYEHVWILKFQVPNLAPATPCATSICSICRISKTDCMARFPRRHRRPFMFCRPIWRRRSWVYPTICNFKTKNRCFEHHFLMCST